MKKLRLTSILIVGSAGLAGCSAAGEDVGTVEQPTLGLSFLVGISSGEFQAARTAFMNVDDINDGLGPVFNERACGNCHNNGAIGGAGDQIERRFGRFVNGVFDPMTANGGSLRQLFALGSFTGANGQSCFAPVEVEPSTATQHAGRLTTPVFGLGLVDAMPDSFFDSLAAAEPSTVRGIVNRVSIVLPNPNDASQRIGGTRVGRFGWKAGVPNLAQFAADAYMNEMGITTQSCIGGVSVTAFATESAPNGIPQPAGCDDLAPPAPAGVPARTDESVGSCAGGLTQLEEDVEEFTAFMTFVAPAPRGNISQEVVAGRTLFPQIGCAGCHTDQTFHTPSSTPNGVPGNFAFSPFSDFLVHDMGTLGDGIGNAGDSPAVTRRMRTAPLWGLRFRHFLLHDGRTSDVATAIRAHDGQGAAARNAFNALSSTDRANVVAFVNSL